MIACDSGYLEVAKWLADVKGASVADKTNVGRQLFAAVFCTVTAFDRTNADVKGASVTYFGLYCCG